MKYKQTHTSIEEMLDILEKRNLNTKDGKVILQEINYSHLIYKYSKPFYDFEPKYIKGTKITDLFRLFNFNKEMSLFLYKYFHKFEHKLKREVASVLTEENAFNYLKVENYKKLKSDRKKKELEKFIENLQEINDKFKRRKMTFFKKHSKEDVLSLWNLVDELALGQLSMLLKFSYDTFSNKVYDNLGIDWKDLSTIRNYRNIIGHMNVITSKIPYSAKGGKTIQYKYFYDLIKILFKIFPECEQEFVLYILTISKEINNKRAIKYIFLEYFGKDPIKYFSQLNSYKRIIKYRFLKLINQKINF